MREATHATVHEAFEGTFECRTCGLEAPAVVVARGRGRASGWHDAAEHTAIQDAAEDAGEIASWTLAFVPCPRCGKRDRLARSYVVTSIALAIVAGLAAAIGVYMLAAMRGIRGVNSFSTAAIVGGGVVAAVVFGLKARAWIGIRRRVSINVSQAAGVPPATIVRR